MTSQPPSDAIDQAVGVVQEVLALAEGQLRDHIPLEDVAAVEIAVRVVEAAVVDVERCVGGGGALPVPTTVRVGSNERVSSAFDQV